MEKEPEIISQNSSQSVLKIHEHQYGQTLLDLTFSEFGFLFGVNDILNMSGSALGTEVDMYIV